MSQWVAVVIIIVFILANDLFLYRRINHHGVKIRDWSLAHDEEFISDLTEAVRKSYVRQMAKDRSDRPWGEA